jgi:serpin B
MHVTASLPFYDGKDVQVIELPYEQSSLAFVIVLPKSAAGKARKDGGLGEMEKKLDERWLSEQLGLATAARVDLALPKLSFAWSSELSAPLQALGIKQAFTTKADFSGLSKLAESQPLAITGVFHKTFLAVDERGTEAAAATGVVVGVKSAAPSKPVVVAVDHPFFFALRDRTSGRLLFTGHVVDPSLK